MKKIIGVDLGGTKTIFHALTVDGSERESIAVTHYASAEFANFEAMLHTFMQQHQLDEIDAMCVGVAGPVIGDHASVTNLPWRMSAPVIERRFAINKVELLNDFQVIGFALDSLPANDLSCLQEGKRNIGDVRALIGAGTGLGHAVITRCHGQDQVMASEAGHIDFAARDGQQDELLRFMRKRHQYVSYEQLVSGPGLEHIYWFLSGGEGDAPPLDAAAISHAAMQPSAKSATNPAWAAMQLFLKIYGSAAGNLALTCLPRGGLFVAGGIAAKILPLFKESEFLQAFRQKSKMQELLEGIPVYIISNPQVGLMGAVARAALV